MLNEDQKNSFVDNGYCTVQIDLDSKWTNWAINLTWSQIDSHFDRDDPKTWVGEIEDDCRSATLAKRRGRLKFKDNVFRHPELIRMMYGNGPVMSAVRSLIGERCVGRHATRGLYPIFPTPQSSDVIKGGMDAHPFQVNAVLYLDDVAEDGGAFSVWEGSHYIMAKAFAGRASYKLLDNVEALRLEAEARCRHVMLPGPRGTLVLWHHRLLHTPTTNRTGKIRYALLADYYRDDWLDQADEPHTENFWEGWPLSAASSSEPAYKPETPGLTASPRNARARRSKELAQSAAPA
ncbi:phytanoyl-CoA dioxygenase family protein [Labrys sp. KNU-23]|uniref:phytanoyl-CoA dioxygenase family protein n=1 Tax=Labrys sp. KNU-23 TaxID=2789216 RepID=UPI0011EE08DA|nr:phytanoyl-CoA dioxygenase family protein [Labrys sp. KNU-23]QEN88474.1 phytanoyl-CoA dioxygenase family protein [Labrys sp. KNU-23]